MNNRVFLITMLLLFCLCLTQLQANNPFDKRIISTLYQKVMTYPEGTLHMEVNYTYTDTEPALVNTMSTSTTTITGEDSTTVTAFSSYEGSVTMENDITKVEYFEYKDGVPGYYGYFKFLFNPDGDLLEFNVVHPSLSDSLHAYFRYRAVNQPDSMYYMKSVNPNVTYYLLYYDELDRLDYSLQYLYVPGEYNTLYRRFTSNYGSEPERYPNSLDFNNHRLYNMSGAWNGAFEESTPIFDKNYAPISIVHEQWDSWNEYWFTLDSSVYGAEVVNNQITLLEGQPGSYMGHYYFDEFGSYIGRHTDVTDGSYNDYYINWSYNVPTEDPVITPAPSVLSVYPNPFKASLNIKLDSKAKQASDISIYNIKGQLIRTWKNVKAEELSWDGRDNNNKPASGGVYLIQAKQGNSTSCRKVIKL